MTKQELIDLCLTYPGAYEDYPFDNVPLVIRHSSNKKMFALIGSNESKVSISLKCDPMKADYLRNVYQSVTPGFNKDHWNTVVVDGDVPHDELTAMIDISDVDGTELENIFSDCSEMSNDLKSYVLLACPNDIIKWLSR